MYIIDVSDPAKPVILDEDDNFYEINDIFASNNGSNLYVAPPGGLLTADIRDISNVKEVL